MTTWRSLWLMLLGSWCLSTPLQATRIGRSGSAAQPAHERSVGPQRAVSYLEFHSRRVQRNLMLFQPQVLGVAPPLHPALLPDEPPPGALDFAAPIPQNALELYRARERLLLFRYPGMRGNAWILGLGAFTVTTVLAAHLPPPARVIFDGKVHLGPAIFDDGGMGAGISGRL